MPTLDASAVRDIVRQRIREAVAFAIRREMEKEGAKLGARPGKDLMYAIEGLVFGDGKAAARAQSLGLSLVRVGLTAMYQKLSSNTDTCTQEHAMDAIYEGLAASRALSRLGFSAAQGLDSVSSECRSVAESTRDRVDVFLLTTLLPSGAIEDLKRINNLQCNFDPGESSQRKLAGILQNLPSDPTVEEALEASRTAAALGDSVDAIKEANCAKSLGALAQSGNTLVALSSQGFSKQTIRALQGVLSPADLACKKPECSSLRDILARSIQKQGLRRGDLIVLHRHILEWLQKTGFEPGGDTYIALVLREVPNALYDPATAPTSIDVTPIAAAVLRKADRARVQGFYIRATVGAGYMLQSRPDKDAPTAPAVWEELGVGYRWMPTAEFRHGPHVMASGLLHQVIVKDTAREGLFAGAGYSLNFARIAELSVNAGALANVKNESGERRSPYFATLVGVQIPFMDYLDAIANTSSDVDTKSVPSSPKNDEGVP